MAGLNPYSNGRYSMGPLMASQTVSVVLVLILILMEDTLWANEIEQAIFVAMVS